VFAVRGIVHTRKSAISKKTARAMAALVVVASTALEQHVTSLYCRDDATCLW